MGADYDGMMWQEMAEFGDYLATLDDAAWDTPSLCEGWRVRDVVSHMITGHTWPVRAWLSPSMKAKGNVDRAAAIAAVTYGDSHTPAEILASWRELVANRTKRGVTRFIPQREGFVDHLVHQQDIRRPLGQPRTIPEDRLRLALDTAMTLGGGVRSKKRVGGIAFEATDLDWRSGEGESVRGTGEAILLAVCGRSDPLPELEGPGVELLAQRAG